MYFILICYFSKNATTAYTSLPQSCFFFHASVSLQANPWKKWQKQISLESFFEKVKWDTRGVSECQEQKKKLYLKEMIKNPT